MAASSHRPPPRGRRMPFSPPEGSIERGAVVRIEPYGAFVQLEKFQGSGLVHISELTTYKVESVDDVISMNDVVWVRVLAVTETQDDQGRTRHRIKLSMKDVSQEDGADMSSGKPQDAQSKALEQSLSSSIGMGVALDPMANYGTSSSSLVMKHEKDSHKTLINGYALVDDDEGEPSPPPQPLAMELLRPMAAGRGAGRGRGMTLPAWMTAREQDGPVGDSRSPSRDSSEGSRRREKKRRKKHERLRESDRRRDARKHTKHKRDERKRDRRRRDDSVSVDKDSHDRGQRRRNREYKRRRSRSHSFDSTHHGHDDRRKTDGRDSRRSRDRQSRGHNRTTPHRRHSGSYSDSSRPSRGDSESVDPQFRNVEEAEKIIALLESKKTGRDR